MAYGQGHNYAETLPQKIKTPRNVVMCMFY